MLTNRVKWAIGLVALLALGVPRSEAAEIRDEAGLFSSGAVKKAGSVLDQIERRTRVPVVIETVSEIPGLDRNAPEPEKRRAIDSLAERRARQIGHEGVYLLISKHDRVFSPLLVKEKYSALLPREKRHEVRDLLLSEFKAGRFDEGLVRTAAFLDDALTAAPAAAEGVPGPIGVPARRHGAAQAGKFGIGTLFTIGLVIFGVLLLLRLLGGVFNRGGGGYGTPTGMGGMPRPGMGPGYGPGYGGGYGAPRGGFFSGMLGGLGGALAGNWLYDQFSGRHSGHVDSAAYPTSDTQSPVEAGDNDFVGGNDDGGQGTSWADPGAGDTGGDWGGGDGGGDWGGGDGGGDWGGGGDGGGW